MHRKALLAARSDAALESYLRRRSAKEADPVDKFLEEYEEIRKTRIATNVSRSGKRFAIATTVHHRAGEAVAAITLVGPTSEVQPRVNKPGQLLLQHVDSWSHRPMTPREAI